MDWSDSYTKRVNRLLKRIPEGAFECLPGCSKCCRNHGWTWAEWEKVKDKRYAKTVKSACPYASESGCEVYEQRPVICRLYGLAGVIQGFNPGEGVSIGCPLGIQPLNALGDGEAREILHEYLKLIRSEMADGAHETHAGPYGRIPGGFQYSGRRS